MVGRAVKSYQRGGIGNEIEGTGRFFIGISGIPLIIRDQN